MGVDKPEIGLIIKTCPTDKGKKVGTGVGELRQVMDEECVVILKWLDGHQ